MATTTQLSAADVDSFDYVIVGGGTAVSHFQPPSSLSFEYTGLRIEPKAIR